MIINNKLLIFSLILFILTQVTNWRQDNNSEFIFILKLHLSVKVF